jgi:predicted nucleic acid-binding protein
VPRGNPSPKLAITIDPNVHEDVLAAAAREGVSVSAWMTSAAREALRRRAGLAAIEVWEKQHGRFTTEEMDAVRRKSAGATAKVAKGAAFGMNTVVYDAGVLVAAGRNERRAWAEHKVRLEFGVVSLVPAPVIAQVSRSPQQAQLRRFLAGCVIVPFGEDEAHEAGRLLGKTRTSDIVEAVVVTTAIRQKATILPSDPKDIGRLVRASGREIVVIAV